MAMLTQMVDGVVVHKFELNNTVTTIGRSATNDIVIDDSAVSGAHAEIACRPNPDFPEFVEYYLTDSGSTNGTEVNGQEIKSSTKLNNNDQIKVAWNEFKFIDKEQESLEKTAHIIK